MIVLAGAEWVLAYSGFPSVFYNVVAIGDVDNEKNEGKYSLNMALTQLEWRGANTGHAGIVRSSAQARSAAIFSAITTDNGLVLLISLSR